MRVHARTHAQQQVVVMTLYHHSRQASLQLRVQLTKKLFQSVVEHNFPCILVIYGQTDACGARVVGPAGQPRSSSSPAGRPVSAPWLVFDGEYDERTAAVLHQLHSSSCCSQLG